MYAYVRVAQDSPGRSPRSFCIALDWTKFQQAGSKQRSFIQIFALLYNKAKFIVFNKRLNALASRIVSLRDDSLAK